MQSIKKNLDATSILSIAPVTVSVVSHGHGDYLKSLLEQLVAHSASYIYQVIITLNIKELGLIDFVFSRNWPFLIKILKNSSPKGFGKNHNQAFEFCITDYYCVLNPDVEIKNCIFKNLIAHFNSCDVGCVYPMQMNLGEVFQDKAREIPSPSALFRRYFFPKFWNPRLQNDWINGSCLLFSSNTFKTLCGFDERYFMYCEDVDICLRLKILGMRIELAPNAFILHYGGHASKKKFTHFVWHVNSLLILWFSKSYKEYIKNISK